MISSRIVLLVCLLSMGGLLFAGTITSVPIADQKADGFWGLQFRGVSFDASGENVAVTLWVNTGDSAANGAITVTNTDTSTVVFSQNYWNTSGYFGLQYLDDVAAFHLSPGNYSVTLTAREFSRASVIYGN